MRYDEPRVCGVNARERDFGERSIGVASIGVCLLGVRSSEN